jgi:hypothetical protein
MKSTLTEEQRQAIADYVLNHHLTKGLGDREDACSIAAINLALTNALTDRIPDCMSPVIGRWIIVIQDAMPDDMRNGIEWKLMLPGAAGTGRELENRRLDLILNWMWEDVLPLLSELADKSGFGRAWNEMLKSKSREAAAAAHAATYAADAAAYAADAAAYAAAYAADAAAYAARAAADAAVAIDAAAAHAAAAAIDAAVAITNFWAKINPPALLKRLVELN